MKKIMAITVGMLMIFAGCFSFGLLGVSSDEGETVLISAVKKEIAADRMTSIKELLAPRDENALLLCESLLQELGYSATEIASMSVEQKFSFFVGESVVVEAKSFSVAKNTAIQQLFETANFTITSSCVVETMSEFESGSYDVFNVTSTITFHVDIEKRFRDLHGLLFERLTFDKDEFTSHSTMSYVGKYGTVYQTTKITQDRKFFGNGVYYFWDLPKGEMSQLTFTIWVRAHMVSSGLSEIRVNQTHLNGYFLFRPKVLNPITYDDHVWYKKGFGTKAGGLTINIGNWTFVNV